jgi:hypothetical protein
MKFYQSKRLVLESWGVENLLGEAENARKLMKWTTVAMQIDNYV